MGGGNAPLDFKHGQFMGNWGNLGSQPQKGVTTYSISANRQRPLAGTLHAAFFNTYRRCKAQALYVVPPFAIAYMAVTWAVEKNEYYNSKPARMHDAAAQEATQGGTVRG